jgi:hypothetical protein
MADVLKTVGDNWIMHWIDGADHSFHVLKKSGRSDEEVMKEIGEAVASWLRHVV